MGFKIPDAASAADAVSQQQLVAASISRQSVTLNLAALQAAGAVLTNAFNVGAVLPANARVVGAEIVVGSALNGSIGFVSAVASVEGAGDAAGSLIAAASVATTGTKGGIGTNPYLSRGGQQITTTVTLVGINLSALTAGSLTVNIFYTVIA